MGNASKDRLIEVLKQLRPNMPEDHAHALVRKAYSNQNIIVEITDDFKIHIDWSATLITTPASVMFYNCKSDAKEVTVTTTKGALLCLQRLLKECESGS